MRKEERVSRYLRLGGSSISVYVPFDGPLRRTINGERRYAFLATDGCYLLDPASWRAVLLSHDLKRSPSDVEKAKIIDLHLRSDLLIRKRFELSTQPITGVVDDNVDSAELFQCSIKSVVD